MIKPLPPVKYLRQCFDYIPETGALVWRARPREHFADLRSYNRCNTMYAGNEAGTIGKLGYRVVLLKPTRYTAHRIVWKLMTGDEPPAMIDHVNGVRTNNQWVNLRAATPFGQVGNQCVHNTNTSGYRGVSAHKSGKWVATIAGQYLGYFDTPEEAAVIYDTAARKRYGDFYGGTYHGN